MPELDPTTDDDAIVIAGVEKRFGSFRALRDVSMAIRRGEVVSIIGSSGSGKSTLLRCINGLEPIHGGRIHVDGELVAAVDPHGRHVRLDRERVTRTRQRIGMVFQQFNLFPHWSAYDNVARPQRIVQRHSKKSAHERTLVALEQVGMAAFERARPGQLSGGQQQRVAIARALAMQPQVMLFDEATSALDPELVGEVHDVMTRLAEEGMTMVVVTHHMPFAISVSHRIYMMHEGEVLESGTPAELTTVAKHERTRRFFETSRA